MRNFQQRCFDWAKRCFGPKEVTERIDIRAARFLEEALELVQATELSKAAAMDLVDYVYSRPTGESAQEVGGVMVTLGTLCGALGLDLDVCANTEQLRCEQIIDKIRAKSASKPKFGSLRPTAFKEDDFARVGWLDNGVQYLVKIQQSESSRLMAGGFMDVEIYFSTIRNDGRPFSIRMDLGPMYHTNWKKMRGEILDAFTPEKIKDHFNLVYHQYAAMNKEPHQ